jgi:hypothetical protein
LVFLSRVTPGAVVALAAPDDAAVRHRLFDRRSDRFEIVRKIARDQRGARRHHAAADVDTDRRRDHGALGRDHRANGRADADMDVGHHRDMLEHERHLRRARELRPRAVFDRHATRPHLDRHAALDMLIVVSRLGHRDLLRSSWCRRRGVARHFP